MSLLLMGGNKIVAADSLPYEYLRPTVALPTGTSFNATSGRIEGDTYAPTFPTQTGTVHNVTNESELTTALSAAVRGDTIRLTADITLTAARTLPNPSGDGWVVIEGDTLPSTAYGAGIVTASEVTAMRKLIMAHGGTGLTAPDAATLRLWIRGINFACDSTSRSFNEFLRVRNNTATLNTQMPDEIVIDRCGFSGPSSGNVNQRAMLLGTRRSRVVGCRMTDIISSGSESKCISVIDGGGPYQVDHNYMEGIGMSVLVGGGAMLANDSAFVPSDMLFRRNHMNKPGRWNQYDTANYDAATYSRITANSKNPFEAKVGRRVCLTENVFEGVFQSAQSGTAVLLKQDGSGQTAQVLEDCLVYLNQAINCNRAWGLSMDGDNQTGGSRGVHFVANVAWNVNATSQATALYNPIYIFAPGETSPAVTTYNPTFTDIAFKWLTVVGPRIRTAGIELVEPSVYGARRKYDGVQITDSILLSGTGTSAIGQSGLIGASGWGGHGNPTIDANFVNTTIERLAAVGATVTLTNYPNSGTHTNIPVLSNIGFTTYDTNLRLDGSSPLIAFGDGGRPLGAPVDLIESVITGVRQA